MIQFKWIYKDIQKQPETWFITALVGFIISSLSYVIGFLNMPTIANNNGVKRIVYSSSSLIYEKYKELLEVEEHTGNLLSPYVVAKHTNELYANIFYRCYKIEPIDQRDFNIFSKRQEPKGTYTADTPYKN